MRAVPYALGAVLVVAVALLVWLFTNERDSFLAECMPRHSVEWCVAEWEARGGKP